MHLSDQALVSVGVQLLLVVESDIVQDALGSLGQHQLVVLLRLGHYRPCKRQGIQAHFVKTVLLPPRNHQKKVLCPEQIVRQAHSIIFPFRQVIVQKIVGPEGPLGKFYS